MGKIKILPETTQHPLTLMGMRAGVCYNSDISDDDKNRKRGIECLKSGHGRVMEYVNVEAIIDGYSSRVIREWYTHIGGSPTRLQESTRYCNCENFDYVEPNLNYEQASVYKVAMGRIKESYKALLAEGVSKEDAANILPLGMTTKIVDKRNLRNIVDMSHVRMCNSAYWEYRELFHDYKEALKNISDEWEYIVNNYFKPKCDIMGFCNERKSCGLHPEEELK